jgi:bifunctional non-homologous end joining protein LigD
MGLETYRQKRNFDRTAEPRGRQSRRTGHGFVVQKHAARSLHYDFRLELGGVLLSWAVPKGPSLDPKVKRLAMQTEDHPLDYGEFEGVIPEGEYGGGTVLLWDRGTWEPEGDAQAMYERGRLSFALHGEKLRGKFHLVRTPGRGKRDDRRWLLFKSQDEAAQPGSDAEVLSAHPESVASGRDIDAVASDPDHVWTSNRTTPDAAPGKAKALPTGEAPGAKRARLPEFIEPQLATLSPEAPGDDDWLHEIKLDGYRILARIENGQARLLSRRGLDWTSRLPSLASALGKLPVESGLLDGEVVVLRANGVSDFQRLQNSMEAGRDVDCTYFAFDAPFLGGHDLRGVPLSERKRLLKAVIVALKNTRVIFGDHVQGNGPQFFERACKLGLEGIVSKRASGLYTSGRGKSWLKVKCLLEQEFVVGGFSEPAGSRRHFGALLLGVREDGVLRYAGKVGTGFTQASLAELAGRLAPLEQKQAPFDNPPSGAERKGVHWVRPELVAQVAYVERTQDGLIRHASFQGLREDKAAEDVHLETPEAGQARARTQKKASKKNGSTPAATAKSAPSKKARARAVTKKNGATRAPTAASASAAPVPPIELDFSRLEITHPDRVLFPDQGITKRQLMLYYARVARLMLPQVVERPLMLVRCPEGANKQCFHQKHPSRGMPKAVEQVMVPQKNGEEANLMIVDVEGLLGLVQMGALEIHTWGCKRDRLDAPDQLVFDLDPDEGLAWERVVEAAHALRTELRRHELAAYVRLTGGKGLHLVVPLVPSLSWEDAKRFSKAIADALVAREPGKYLSTMTKSKRKGKIFLDYFRNGQGATAVCSYSTRARGGAPLALPIGWDELDAGLRSDSFQLGNIEQRLVTQRRDPWQGFDQSRVPITR